MTTGEQLLGLAGAAIPGSKWVYDEGNECVRRVADDGGMEEDFDPANNADQFCDVLAWLLAQTCVEIQACTESYVKVIILTDMNDPRRFTFDGTAADIRRAVTEAAVRVARGMV